MSEPGKRASFDYCVFRVVPRVERQEFVNVGVLVYCPEKRFLQAKMQIDETRLRALWPSLDIDTVRQHAEGVMRICAGDTSAGPIAGLLQRERFHWLSAPRSTVLQPSAVHTGVCSETDGLVERLFQQLVASDVGA